jgi:hypothetical protein
MPKQNLALWGLSVAFLGLLFVLSRGHKKEDLAQGAANWLSVGDYKNAPAWAGRCAPVVIVADHTFLKCL